MATSFPKTLALPFALMGALFLAGCGGGEDTSRVTRSDRNDLQQACMESTNAGEQLCTCVADLANEDLSPAAFHLVLASVEGETERAQEMSSEMTVEENAEAAAFIFGAFAQCAQATSN